MAVLFVNNHLSKPDEIQQICSKNNLQFGGTLTSAESVIADGYSYAISPCEAGIAYVISLFDKFDQVKFLKNHNNFPVLIMQKELEILYNKSYKSAGPLLDTTKIHFFGCSHTYGTGHDSKSTTFPSILSTHIKLDYHNYGMPGSGNYDIEDLMNQFTIQNSKIVVQFTDMYRIRYCYNNEVIKTPIHHAEKYVQHAVLFNEENLFFNFQKIVQRIVNRLQEGNNQFILTYTHNIDAEYSIKCLEFLLEYKQFQSMQGCAVDVGTDGLHFGVNTMELWANRLFTKWLELYG